MARRRRITSTNSKPPTTKRQFEIIDEYLLKHPKLPHRGPRARTLNGYQLTEVNELWEMLVYRLNACGPPERNLPGWKSVWLRRRRQQKRFAKYIIARRERPIEPDVVPEISQNDMVMSTIYQDEIHIKNELVEENVHEDSHELFEENDELQTQHQSEQRCHQECRCCCGRGTRTNEQCEIFHIEILKILEENNKLLKEILKTKNEETNADDLMAEELRLKKIELKNESEK